MLTLAVAPSEAHTYVRIIISANNELFDEQLFTWFSNLHTLLQYYRMIIMNVMAEMI